VIGDLYLQVLPGIDFTPLRSLRDVEGTLAVLGGNGTGVVPGAQLLEALRGLEEAGGLQLSYLRLDSFEPLSGLRRLGAATSQLPARPETLDKVTAPEDRDYLSYYGLSLSNCAGLTSLAGLDSLEELDALGLSNNPDLVSLEGLTRVPELAELQLMGGVVDLRGSAPRVRKLTVYSSPWTDLSPLGDARALEYLELRSNPALVSLTGARLPEHLDGLGLANNPVLANLDGLEALRDIDGLSIWTADPLGEPAESLLASFEGLRGLERVGELHVSSQTRLRTLTGLDALKDVERLELTGNVALENLEALSSLERVGGFFLGLAPRLTTLSGLGSARIGMLQLLDVGIVDLSGLEQVSVETELGIWRAPQLVSLRGLPQLGPDALLSLTDVPALSDAQPLEAVTALGALNLENTSISRLAAPGLQALRSFIAWGNPELVELSLGALRTLDELRLLANASLLRVDLRQLESLHELEITNNTQLYESSLDALLELGAAPAEIDRNSRIPARLDPCPWTGDGLCDETSRLCAAGSDTADCGAP
jgi:hypothetical protein